MAVTETNPTVWEMVAEAVKALGGVTTNTAVRQWVWNKYPGTNRSTINCQLVAGSVNHPSRVHYGIDARPRHADRREIDRYFRPAKGQIELYDPARHGAWEIYTTPDSKLSVRKSEAGGVATAMLPAAPLNAPALTPVSIPTVPVRRSVARGESRGGEMGWVASLQPRLEAALQSLSLGSIQVRVDAGWRLPYACEVLGYKGEKPEMRAPACYEADLLVYDDEAGADRWTPRVVVECKLGSVTTHDALTYSAKAATHKQVHPYLRYGILIGGYGASIPARLVRHGAHFDFMAVWHAAVASQLEWEGLLKLLIHEVEASRQLQQLLCTRNRSRQPFHILHRPLVIY